MTLEDLKVGMLVHLNSGSPALTVTRVKGQMVLVEWINDDGLPQEAEFPAVCLKVLEITP